MKTKILKDDISLYNNEFTANYAFLVNDDDISRRYREELFRIYTSHNFVKRKKYDIDNIRHLLYESLVLFNGHGIPFKQALEATKVVLREYEQFFLEEYIREKEIPSIVRSIYRGFSMFHRTLPLHIGILKLACIKAELNYQFVIRFDRHDDSLHIVSINDWYESKDEGLVELDLDYCIDEVISPLGDLGLTVTASQVKDVMNTCAMYYPDNGRNNMNYLYEKWTRIVQ